MEEIWKDIEGYYGLYQVSNKGNVKSLERNVKGKNGSYYTVSERMLKPRKNRYGYLYVHLHKEGKIKIMLIHRLVASAFVQNDSLFNTEINHKNEIKSDNRAENLEWCDRKYNCNYGTRNERRSKKVKCIDTGKIYPTISDVHRQFGFSQGNISQCCNGKLKSAYGCRWEYV